MELFMVGLNYRSAPLAVREAFALSEDEVADGREGLLERRGVNEAALIATCNRTELYVVADDVAAADAGISRFFQSVASGAGTLPPRGDWLYKRRGRDAAKHLFRVAAGLDSMVVGEAQILGQVRATLHRMLEAGGGGPVLPRLFRSAVEAGKRARTETEIGVGALSISHAAVELARGIFGDLRGRRVCLVGAGKMGALTARNLSAHGASTVIVNRTADVAQRLADALEMESAGFEDLGAQLAQADVVVASTGSTGPVITKDVVGRALAGRRGKRLFLIDIAVPRDVEPDVARLDGVALYNIDDLEEIVRRNGEERAREIPAVEAIIREEEARFFRWLQERRAVPAVRQMRARAEKLRRDEVARTVKKHPELGEAGKVALEAATAALVNKLLHTPTVQLKRWARDVPEGEERLRHACELFGLAVAPEVDDGAGKGGSECEGCREREGGSERDGEPPGTAARLPDLAAGEAVAVSMRREMFGRTCDPDSGWDAPKRLGSHSDGAGSGRASARVSGGGL